MKKRRSATLEAIFAFLVILVSVVPFVHVFLSSFLTIQGVSFQAYYDVFLGSPLYLHRFWRSMGMAVCVALFQLVVSVLGGYGFAKYRFPLRNGLLFLLMLLMALPVQVTLVPGFITLSAMGLLDTYAALILPAIFIPLGTFILTQSFKAISDSVIDAAMIDGCGLFGTLLKVAVPMSKNGLVCVVLLSFLDAWNMVEQPIAFLKEFEDYPLSVALAYAPPGNQVVQQVCCVLVVLPPLALFALFNRELVEGVVLAEVK